MTRVPAVLLMALAVAACTESAGPTDLASPTNDASPSGGDASPWASISDGGSDGGSPLGCTPTSTQCSGNGVETCGSEGQWGAGVACDGPTPACAAGVCVKPPSCAASAMGTTHCGASGESCCASPEVPGGTYDRTYTNRGGGATDAGDPATISSFRLDKYLVTVGRFRQYVNYLAGSTGAPPANGSGIHTHLNGGQGLANSGSPATFETGWDGTDWSPQIATGSGAASVWDTNLGECYPYSTWSTAAGSQENLPINCVPWYEAYAFCIWDGGFLPSEAEWEYVAAGGNQEREYPWGEIDPGSASLYAIYACDYASGSDSCGLANVAPVGTAPLGAASWGQLDMAGEVFEWNLDGYAPYVDPCADCAYLSLSSDRVTRGGNYSGTPMNMLASNRTYTDDPTDRDNVIGFRCARTP
jgi:sulfatase modifying factor 1